jgi:hypothetical protein
MGLGFLAQPTTLNNVPCKEKPRKSGAELLGNEHSRRVVTRLVYCSSSSATTYSKRAPAEASTALHAERQMQRRRGPKTTRFADQEH